MMQHNSIPLPTPCIPHDEVTPETINAGIIVRLGPKDVFWKLEGGAVELNAFTGRYAAKIEERTLTEYETLCVLRGIRTGRLMVVDSIENGTPVSTTWLMSEYAPRARRLLDHADDEFARHVQHLYSLPVLHTALHIEKEEHNRKDRVQLLSAAIATLTQG